MDQNSKPDDQSGGAHIDNGELADAAPPLPGEGHGDPLTKSEPTALEAQVDPDTGMPVRREGYR